MDEAVTYLDALRSRIGRPDTKATLAVRGQAFNQNDLREFLRRERRVELAYEESRYYDVRRWMIADKDGEGRQNGYAHGMNVRGTINDTEEFNRVVETEKIVFNRKMYLQPIPDHEMRKTQNLVQNPGW